MLVDRYADKDLNVLEQYLRLIKAHDKAKAVIDTVNYYGADVSKWPKDIARAIRSIVCNCYWRGMFGEQGMICSRCNRECSHRI